MNAVEATAAFLMKRDREVPAMFCEIKFVGKSDYDFVDITTVRFTCVNEGDPMRRTVEVSDIYATDDGKLRAWCRGEGLRSVLGQYVTLTIRMETLKPFENSRR